MFAKDGAVEESTWILNTITYNTIIEKNKKYKLPSCMLHVKTDLTELWVSFIEYKYITASTLFLTSDIV